MKKRIISFILAFATCCTFLSACDKESSAQEAYVAKKYTYTDGVHDFTAPETEEYLVRNGNTEYSLVLPEKQGKFITVAESEFKTFFKQATGINIKTIAESDDGLTHNATNKYISIGETKMLDSADITMDYEKLGVEGVRIVTKDNTIYLVGGSDQGTLNAVYDFMQIVFNFEIYSNKTNYFYPI